MPPTHTQQSSAATGTPQQELSLHTRLRRGLILGAILAIPVVFSTRLSIAGDPDIWWHLRTGEWIVQHRAVPFIDPFAAHAVAQPWIAYSWSFEILLYAMFRTFGLMGIVGLQALLLFATAVAIHNAISRRTQNFVIAGALTVAVLVSLLPMMTPRPWLFSILFFILELDLLFQTRQDGLRRRLLWLIPVFAFWANIHIQFVYGLFVLFLSALEPLIASLLRRTGVHIPVQADASPSWLLCACCSAATLLSPYSWRVYQVVIHYANETGAYNLIGELHAFSFRSFPDYAILLLTVGAFFALGWRREHSPFPILLLAATTLVAFRSSRDGWFVCLPAAMLIAPGTQISGQQITQDRRQFAAATAIVLIAFAVTASIRHVNNTELNRFVTNTFPDRAAAYVQNNRISGPLFNDFDWGGYLIWRLPEMPVAIDGRTNVYGDRLLVRSVATWNAEDGWQSDPKLASAKVVIGPKSAPLSSALRNDGRFRLVYEDEISVVFVLQAH